MLFPQLAALALLAISLAAPRALAWPTDMSYAQLNTLFGAHADQNNHRLTPDYDLQFTGCLSPTGTDLCTFAEFFRTDRTSFADSDWKFHISVKDSAHLAAIWNEVIPIFVRHRLNRFKVVRTSTLPKKMEHIRARLADFDKELKAGKMKKEEHEAQKKQAELGLQDTARFEGADQITIYLVPPGKELENLTLIREVSSVLQVRHDAAAPAQLPPFEHAWLTPSGAKSKFVGYFNQQIGRDWWQRGNKYKPDNVKDPFPAQ